MYSYCLEHPPLGSSEVYVGKNKAPNTYIRLFFSLFAALVKGIPSCGKFNKFFSNDVRPVSHSSKMADNKIDGIFRTRTLGIAAQGLPDQYADGKAAKLWNKYIGDQQQRTGYYREKMLNILRSHNVKHVFDVACGTGSVVILSDTVSFIILLVYFCYLARPD